MGTLACRPHSWVHRRLFLVPKTSGIASTGWLTAVGNGAVSCRMGWWWVRPPPQCLHCPKGAPARPVWTGCWPGGSSQSPAEAPLGRGRRVVLGGPLQDWPSAQEPRLCDAGASRNRGNPRSSLEWGRSGWGSPAPGHKPRKPQLCFLTGGRERLRVLAGAADLAHRKKTDSSARTLPRGDRSLESIHLGWSGGGPEVEDVKEAEAGCDRGDAQSVGSGRKAQEA